MEDDCKTCPHKSPEKCPCTVIKVIPVSDEELDKIKKAHDSEVWN